MHSRIFRAPLALALSLGVTGCVSTSPPQTETASDANNTPSPRQMSDLPPQRLIDLPISLAPSGFEYIPPPPTDLYSSQQSKSDTPDNNPYFWAILGRWFIVDKADPTRKNTFPCDITFTGQGLRAATNQLVRTRFRAWGAKFSCRPMRMTMVSEWALFGEEIYLFNTAGNFIGAVKRVSEDLWESGDYELRREEPD